MSLFLIAPSRARCITIPGFLCPAFTEASCSQPQSHRTFSTSPSSSTRRTSGPNKQRGVSAIRSKNPGQRTEVYRYDLPTPVTDPSVRKAFSMNPNHGLWGFFDKRRPLLTPIRESQHGRAWAVKELQIKSFDDLHKLYYVSLLEVNRVATRQKELRRTSAGYGEPEQRSRMKTARRTMANIREVLESRYDSWQAARKMMEDKYLGELTEEIDAEYEERELTVEEVKERRRWREVGDESQSGVGEVLLEGSESQEPSKHA